MEINEKFYKTKKGFCYHLFSCNIIKQKIINEYFLIDAKEKFLLKPCKFCLKSNRNKISQDHKGFQPLISSIEEQLFYIKEEINLINTALKNLGISDIMKKD